METILEKLQGFALYYGPRVRAAVATLVIGWIVARILVSVGRRIMTRAQIDATLIGFCGNLLFMLPRLVSVSLTVEVNTRSGTAPS